MISHYLRLADDRRLGYTDYGDPSGQPVLLFHGLPGSRLQGHPDRSIATSLGARVIGVDRPGFGLSDYQAGRTLLDWPDDVESLADNLRLERFAVLGISGGVPYAAACAWKIPDRLAAVAFISGIGPVDDPRVLQGMPWLNRLMLASAKRSEWLVRLPAACLLTLARYWPDQYLSIMNAHLPGADRSTYTRPDVQLLIREDLQEAFRKGARGAVRDIILLTRPWGFSVQALRVPVRLWHGIQDTTVPIRIGRALAATLPCCRARFVPGAGHFLIIDSWRQILAELLD